MWHSDTSMGTGVGNTQIDVPMSTMVSMVREVLPHVPVELITQVSFIFTSVVYLLSSISTWMFNPLLGIIQL
jgi:hypothetical protein